MGRLGTAPAGDRSPTPGFNSSRSWGRSFPEDAPESDFRASPSWQDDRRKMQGFQMGAMLPTPPTTAQQRDAAKTEYRRLPAGTEVAFAVREKISPGGVSVTVLVSAI